MSPPPTSRLLSPSSAKNIPSVVMKDGTPKRTTTTRFVRPIPAATNSDRRRAVRIGTPLYLNRITHTIGINAYTVPTERSNSPAIISRQTATATMPNVEAAVLTAVRLWGSKRCEERALKIAPAMRRPSAGASSCFRRAQPAILWSARLSLALGNESQDRVDIRPIHHTCSGIHVDGGEPKLQCESEIHNRHVALQEWLLIDRETDHTLLNVRRCSGTDIKCSNGVAQVVIAHILGRR